MRARKWVKIAAAQNASGLFLAVPDHIRDGDHVQWIVRSEMSAAVASVSRRLKHQREDEIVFEQQPHTIADLRIVYTFGQRRNDGRSHTRRAEVFQGAPLEAFLIASATQAAEFWVAERVELEVHISAATRQLVAEVQIGSDTHAVCGNRDARNLRTLGKIKQSEEVRMDRGFSARKVNRVQCAFLFDQSVNDGAKLRSGHVVVVPVLNDANGAFEIAIVRDLDDRQATVLFVIRAQAAVRRTAFGNRCGIFEWHGAGLDVEQ